MLRRDPRALRAARFALAAAIVAAGVVGCATAPRPIRTEVTTFDDWSALPTERTYAFARTLEFKDSLEVRQYEALVRDELAHLGFRDTDAGDANLVVTLRPSVSWTSVRVREPWFGDPWFGFPYGGYGRFGGPYIGAPYGGPYWGPGWYGGVYGRSVDEVSVDVFKARLELDIDSRTQIGKRYYEGRVESATRGEPLARAMPILIRALFTDFPGNNGQTRRVDVPVVRVDARAPAAGGAVR